MIALVDVNNFYVSCQRVFEPHLVGKPVVVLSNNDGCIISRSAEAKALGIPMAAPWHQLSQFARAHGVIAYSSNYALYADMSQRVMQVLARFSPQQEVYSIDECFLGLHGVLSDHTELGLLLKQTVWRWTGLPICVGIAPTKTLAKLANHIAKQRPEFAGVCEWEKLPVQQRQQFMATMDVGEVWGIGRKLSVRLKQDGIHTVADLAASPAEQLRQRYGVVLQRIVAELNGCACLELEEVTPDKQQILCSRSFGQPIFSEQQLAEAISTYLARAAEKLRQQNSLAGAVGIFIRTNPFRPNEPQYRQQMVLPLTQPSNDTLKLTRIALRMLARLYRSGFAYAKAGVMLTQLQPKTAIQGHLFLQTADPIKRAELNATLDAINRRWGRGAIGLACAGNKKPAWAMNQQHLSPYWTTRWPDIPVALAK
ncbi:Y-family DNA polymerase [Chitinibacter fontanus]|uniref:Y-family DNA polymerase n=1 Tax=Chitinibacter fontanus TaxID=1737446 RepID=A0A7D5VA04_9NEIS|nr:Y-family DNA polymerase [Chitinibacter fontanus]QLI81694.1 Y-family DNA polymerase [Chitinibacter fontanus]